MCRVRARRRRSEAHKAHARFRCGFVTSMRVLAGLCASEPLCGPCARRITSALVGAVPRPTPTMSERRAAGVALRVVGAARWFAGAKS